MTLRFPFFPTTDVQALVEAIAGRDARIRELENTCTELKQTIARQAALISELELCLGLDSTNSSKPLSSDGLKKPPAPKRTHVKGRKPGGQKGHKGTTLLRSEKPDHVEDHFPYDCAHCGHTLDDGMSVRFETRQVHDIPEPLPLRVVDHRAHVGICPQYNGETKASFPEGIGSWVQYGPHLMGLVLDFNTHQLIPVKRLVKTFRDLFGVKLSTGTVVNMVSHRAIAYGGIVDTIRAGVVQARVKPMDETGLRIGGRLQWRHVAYTNLLTYLWIGKGRSDVMLEALSSMLAGSPPLLCPYPEGIGKPVSMWPSNRKPVTSDHHHVRHWR